MFGCVIAFSHVNLQRKVGTKGGDVLHTGNTMVFLTRLITKCSVKSH